MKPDKLQKLIISILEEHKALDIVTLNIKKMADFADYMIICSGTSNRHVSAIANNLVVKLKEHDIRPLGKEEDPNSSWVLVDLGDVIVHVMQPQIREFYDLEKLWEKST